jgi:hypothetical protein
MTMDDLDHVLVWIRSLMHHRARPVESDMALLQFKETIVEDLGYLMSHPKLDNMFESNQPEGIKI